MSYKYYKSGIKASDFSDHRGTIQKISDNIKNNY